MSLKAERKSSQAWLPKLLILEAGEIKIPIGRIKKRTTIGFSAWINGDGSVIVREPRPRNFVPKRFGDDLLNQARFWMTDEECGLMVNRYVPYGESFEIVYDPKNGQELVRYKITGGKIEI